MSTGIVIEVYGFSGTDTQFESAFRQLSALIKDEARERGFAATVATRVGEADISLIGEPV